MADAPQQPGKPKTPFSVRFALFMLLVASVLFLPSTTIFFVCMIPTLVAILIDNNPQKTAWLTVGSMNLAGTIPVWIALLDKSGGSLSGPNMAAALQLIMQPTMLVLAYGGAGVGWVLYNRVTPLIAGMVQAKNERRLRDIEKIQKELVRKWGEGVVSGS